MKKRLFLFLNTGAILFTIYLIPESTAHAAGHQEICTGAKLQQGQCRAYAGANFTIDFSDLRLDPGQYFLTYRGQPTGAFFSRCINVGNDRWFKVENFPGAGIGKAAFELWKARSGGNVCTAGKTGNLVSLPSSVIQFDPPKWVARVSNPTRKIGEFASILVYNLPTDGQYRTTLETPGAGYIDTTARARNFSFSDSANLYKPGMRLTVSRMGENLGEAVIWDENPCAPDTQDPAQCRDADGNRREIKPTEPALATTSLPTSPSRRDGIGASKITFRLPEDPTIFKNLPLFALFGGGAGTGAIGLLTLLLALGLIASFVFFVLGAFKYLVSAGDPKKIEGAKNQITAAIIGLVIMASAFFIVQVLERILGIRVTG